MSKQYVIGLDFGSDSVRSVLVDASNGAAQGSEVFWYPRWKANKYNDPGINQYRQHPLDHIEGMEYTIREMVKAAGIKPESVKGICIDTTGSSPVPVLADGTPLALTSGFEENPNAMMVLWKDHTAIAEADEINNVARTWGGIDYTKFVGGIYSSEWFWAKILHIARTDQAVKEAANSWMEHCDVMTHILVGGGDLKDFKRSRCAAGHKAMWHESWGGLPDSAFLEKLDPYLAKLRQNLYNETYTSDQQAGNLSSQWADKLGLTTNCVVAVGTFDAHSGAVGAEVGEKTLVRVMGTSTCDIVVATKEAIGKHTVTGICGQVDGSVIPGMQGLEAGQSAFGDVLAWFNNVLLWPTENLLASSTLLDEKTRTALIEEIRSNLIEELSVQAAKLPLSESAPVALDWINGRRTPDANQNLKGAITRLNLGTMAPHIFRSLVEAISFGAKKIVERFQDEGVEINQVVGIGGVAKKSPFVMQTLANVLNMPIKIAVSDQAPALGAAMYAAVAAGIYTDVAEASRKMGNGFEAEYKPEPDAVKVYQVLYSKYEALGYFVEAEMNKYLSIKKQKAILR